jgi:aldose 1-epimerase
MVSTPIVRRACLALALAITPAPAQVRFTAARSGDIVQLKDAQSGMTVSIAAPLCNAYEVSVRGQQLIRQTFADVAAFEARPGLNGIPLLAPFANRLDEQAFWANGKRYAFDMTLGNVRGEIPIHGFLSNTKDWKVVDATSDPNAAWATCTLDFYRHPLWMKQFPFAHTMTITYRLASDGLEVRFRIDNQSVEPMPVSIGFHPYFQLTDSPRDDWTLSVGARAHYLLAPNKIPTGETEPIERLFPDPKNVAVKDVELDDVFGDLIRDANGRASVVLRGTSQRLDLQLGPNYRCVVLYAPRPRPGTDAERTGRGYVAIEPMAGITDSMNLAQKGLYKELQSIPPGGSWQESFWIRASGY